MFEILDYYYKDTGICTYYVWYTKDDLVCFYMFNSQDILDLTKLKKIIKKEHNDYYIIRAEHGIEDVLKEYKMFPDDEKLASIVEKTLAQIRRLKIENILKSLEEE